MHTQAWRRAARYAPPLHRPPLPTAAINEQNPMGLTFKGDSLPEGKGHHTLANEGANRARKKNKKRSEQSKAHPRPKTINVRSKAKQEACKAERKQTKTKRLRLLAVVCLSRRSSPRKTRRCSHPLRRQRHRSLHDRSSARRVQVFAVDRVGEHHHHHHHRRSPRAQPTCRSRVAVRKEPCKEAGRARHPRLLCHSRQHPLPPKAEGVWTKQHCPSPPGPRQVITIITNNHRSWL